MKAILRGALAATALLAAACSKDAPMDDMGRATPAQAGTPADGGATYTVVVRSMWTKANHPFEYPAAGALTGPHFSGIIGTSHDSSYSLFAQGAMPTPGLEKLSEEGKHTPLDEEIRAAIAGGHAGALFSSGPLRDFTDSIVTTLQVDAAHPAVSFVGMIAPSPDWFFGASNVTLRENGQWAASKTLQLYAYDAGSDDGTTYKAPDRDVSPKKATMQSMTRHFTNAGAPVAVATVTLTRK
jgi:hypothetical protein